MNTKTDEPGNGDPNTLESKAGDEFGIPAKSGDGERDALRVLAENIANLEKELEAEKDNRNEERLYWLFGAFIPVNAVLYLALQDMAPFALLFVFQLTVLLAMAKKFGHDWAVQAIGGFLNWVASIFRKKTD